MTENKFEFIIELGSNKFRGLSFSKESNAKEIYIEKNNNILINSNIKNFNDVNNLLKNFILDLEKESKEYISNINLMIDSSEMKSINFSIFKKMDGESIKEKDIIFLIRDAKQRLIQNQPHLSIAHIVIAKFVVDNQDYSDQPIDIVCDKFSIELNFICFPKNLIKNLENLFHSNTINIDRILCSSYARSLNASKINYNSGKVCFVDIGFEKISILQFFNENLIEINSLPIASNHITKDISKICHLSIEESENIKKDLKIQKKLTNNNLDKQNLEINFFKDTNFKDISYSLLKDVIYSRLDEIIGLIIKNIFEQKNLENKDVMIFFMGNGSKIFQNNLANIEKISLRAKSIQFLNEKGLEICKSGLKLIKGTYKLEAVAVPKKLEKTGFFEKLFHLFR